MEKEEKALVHEAIIRYNHACDNLVCRVAEGHSKGFEETAFQGKIQEFEADCMRMRRIMEEYEAYLAEV